MYIANSKWEIQRDHENFPSLKSQLNKYVIKKRDTDGKTNVM